MSHEATIRDLGSEQNRLKEKILQLEEERERLQKQMQSLEEQQHQKILNQEKVITLNCFISSNVKRVVFQIGSTEYAFLQEVYIFRCFYSFFFVWDARHSYIASTSVIMIFF